MLATTLRSAPLADSLGAGRVPGPWPDAVQTELLHVALGRGERAREALSRWRDSVSPARVDAASRRLLPLAWWNLERHGIAGPGLDVLKEAFVETWVRTQQLLEALETVLAAFRSEGVPVIVYKGAALALGTYPRLGLRPMVDIDFLVPTSAAGEGLRILEGLGARRTSVEPAKRLSMLHGAELLLEREGWSVAVDLHWSALWECRRPGDDDSLRESAVPLPGTVTPARMPCPADHLLVVCVHGLKWSPLPAIHWVADAMMLIERSVDWARLVAEARRRRLAWPVAVALRYLVLTFGAPVPPETLTELEVRGPAWRDRLELSCRSRPPDLRRGLFLHWCDHARRSAIPSPLGRALTFPGYLRDMWAVEKLREVPILALRKALQGGGSLPAPTPAPKGFGARYHF
jgi:hypothetical protein